jgi:hypothetical protein
MCGEQLFTNALATELAWCQNESCSLYIHGNVQVDIVFHLPKESVHDSFWELLIEYSELDVKL